MSNSKIIIVEGAQGAGKTTITDFIRHVIPYTNLYRLSGTADSSPAGREKAEKMYLDLLDYIEKMQNMSINLLFDRTFFTEEIYCRLGFKEYTFSDVYEKLLDRLSKMDFDIYYITLYLSDENEFEKRLTRAGKAKNKYAKFDKQSSINQQNAYLKMADEIAQKYQNIHVVKVDNCREEKIVKEEIRKMLEWKEE